MVARKDFATSPCVVSRSRTGDAGSSSIASSRCSTETYSSRISPARRCAVTSTFWRSCATTMRPASTPGPLNRGLRSSASTVCRRNAAASSPLRSTKRGTSPPSASRRASSRCSVAVSGCERSIAAACADAMASCDFWVRRDRSTVGPPADFEAPEGATKRRPTRSGRVRQSGLAAKRMDPADHTLAVPAIGRK